MKVIVHARLLLTASILALAVCSCQAPKPESAPGKLFTSVPAQKSGIDFQNTLEETESSNYYKYMYSYIGGGVAAADFNKDGLIDLFFISNTSDNKLYLNKGDLKFKDITKEAGIIKRTGFDAGVTVVDVNNDGFLDIYITRGGWQQENNQFANMLYVNNGSTDQGLGFTERAEEFGLADTNRGIHSTFFDYDLDGDLDVYISNTPDFEDKAETVVDLVAAQSDPRTISMKGYDKLYNNDGTGHFTDVSIEAGILPDIGFGLNPQVGDLNNDGWLDIYVCNDFRIPDFAYLNNGDGTFREGRNELLKHMSFNSMGSDIADVNNDGLPDLFALDMNPADYVRSKTTMAMTSLELFADMVQKDYHHQYMHNMLQINNGNGTFREIANFSGVANTDWSWSCLLADFDLDGYNDIYVTNGVFRDVIDRDANSDILKLLRSRGRKPTDADFLEYAKLLPQQKLANFIFRNRGDQTFEDVSSIWADSIPTFSNGATYADLDNDGDLDVVINNINEAATLLKNEVIERNAGNYIAIEFSGPTTNDKGVGTSVKLTAEDGKIQVRQLINSRGFLSAVSNRLHFGLGKQEMIESMEVLWPDGKRQQFQNITANQLLKVTHADAKETDNEADASTSNPLFARMEASLKHLDPPFNDYAKQLLLPHKLSQTGPAVATGDVNGDGLTDVFIGGGHTQAGQVFLATAANDLRPLPVTAFERDKQKEDVGAEFFDADNDGDLDLYVVSGSYEFNLNSKLLLDRLYLNDGQGNFTKTTDRIPPFISAGSVVVAADVDQDGDQDLFVGGRVLPGQYPYPPSSHLLINDGGKFSVQTQTYAPDLETIGMVTDASWHDMDGDSDLDLILTGEWMGIEVFINDRGTLERSSDYPVLNATTGWWNRILIADIDQDEDLDIIAGNLGLNYKIHASADKPFHIYTDDFDYNGTVDVILAKNYDGLEVPVRGRSCTAQQIPHLAQKIPTYKDFASRDVAGILGPGINNALHYEVRELRSGIFYNEGNGDFSFEALPGEAQTAPINGILLADYDGDDIQDLLIAGNNYMAEIETTRSDAGIGLLLKGQPNGSFLAVSHLESGFFTNRDTRHLVEIKSSSAAMVIAVNNNGPHDLFEVRSRKTVQ